MTSYSNCLWPLIQINYLRKRLSAVQRSSVPFVFMAKKQHRCSADVSWCWSLLIQLVSPYCSVVLNQLSVLCTIVFLTPYEGISFMFHKNPWGIQLVPFFHFSSWVKGKQNEEENTSLSVRAVKWMGSVLLATVTNSRVLLMLPESGIFSEIWKWHFIFRSRNTSFELPVLSHIVNIADTKKK